MSFQVDPLFTDPAPRPPRPPSSKQVVAALRSVIRAVGGASRVEEVPPGTLVRWHKKIGDEALIAILSSVPWPKVEFPVAYISAAVRRREIDAATEQNAPKYEVHQGDGGIVVAIRHPDDPTRVQEVLRGSDAVEFLARHADGGVSSNPVSEPTW